METEPVAGMSSPASNPSSVVLPLPDGPIMAANSRSAMEMSMGERTVRLRPALWYVCDMFRAMIMIVKKIAWLAVFIATSSCAVDTRDSDRSSARRPTARDERPVVLFLGTSLTAGMGLTEQEAFPALIQAKIDSTGRDYRVVNAGESGGTSAGGLRRIEWLLRAPIDVLVLELGANDGLRGQDIGALESNLRAIVDKVREAYPGVRVVLAGMEAPPNFGIAYTDLFRNVYPTLASEAGLSLVPFLLEGVAGVDSLNQADGMHPTVEGQRVVAQNVWAVLEGVLR